jgi:hypothetical protein
MESRIPEHHPLRRLFGMLTEKSFTETLRWPDFNVTEYVSNLLVEFTHTDSLFRLRNHQGEQLDSVVEMLYESEVLLHASSLQRELEVHRHIGDFTLFWAGVYPEALSRLKSPDRKDHLIDYCEQGKRSYYIASTFDDEPYREEVPVLRRLSEDFELCSFGLSRVRHEWEKLPEAGLGDVWKAERN